MCIVLTYNVGRKKLPPNVIVSDDTPPGFRRHLEVLLVLSDTYHKSGIRYSSHMVRISLGHLGVECW